MASIEHSILEYLFVDQPRLDTYFEQISDPVAYDKVPVWKVVLGLTGLSAEKTQSRLGRGYTNHEKLTRLVRYLKDKEQLAAERAAHPSNYEKPFTLESMTARRAHIPIREDSPTFQGLDIYYSWYKSDDRP